MSKKESGSKSNEAVKAPEVNEQPSTTVAPSGPTVVEGCCITAKGFRFLQGGDAVSAKDLCGGEKAFNALVDAGLIKK